MFDDRYLYTFLVFLIPVLLPVALAAQTVTGTVKDAKSREPLAGANIVQVDTRNGVSAGPDGAFKLTLEAGSPDRVRISYIGYKSQVIDISQEGRRLEILLVPVSIMSNEVFVRALRVDEAAPMAYENISRDEINKNNLGQDIPYLLSNTPSVTTTSDAGAGIGYTGIRIRGVDPTRINVTINGIPLNDAESHGVFWVDLPDLASSIENIQVQRGVGTSTLGAGAFGATMNLQTTAMRPESYGEVNTGFGSFNTRKINVMLGSGLMENGWQFEGRLSKIDSEGYIDRASSDLRSFFLSGARHGQKSLLKVDVFSGREQTYQAWNGVAEPILEGDAAGVDQYINQLFLPAEKAAHFRENIGNRSFNEFTYEDQTDNYQQDHVQVHYSHKITDRWNLNGSLHYTKGKGYFEELRNEDPLSIYGIGPVSVGDTTITSSDIIRRRWLDNDFYGIVFSSEYESSDQYSLTVGGGYNEYDGRHFGEVIWARFAGESEIDQTYYDNDAFKTDFNLFAKGRYYITGALSAFLDLQVRTITYDFLGKDTRNVNGSEQVVDVQQTDRLTFFNPKAGFVYRLSGSQRFYASLSIANREPTREEYVNSTTDSRPDHETLYDWELGYRGTFDRFFVGANFYFMDYKNQLALTGEINDVGAFIRQNVPDSYRAGLELQAGVRITPVVEWSGNATISRNKISEYTQFLSDFDAGGQISKIHTDTDLAFSPSFIANSVIGIKKGRVNAELVTKYVSRQYLDNTQTRERSIDPYFINDLRIGYTISTMPFVRSIRTTLQVNNLLNESYVSNGYTFGWKAGGEEQHFNFFYPQASRHFLVQVQFKF